jgi:hypothetical protein
MLILGCFVLSMVLYKFNSKGNGHYTHVVPFHKIVCALPHPKSNKQNEIRCNVIHAC